MGSDDDASESNTTHYSVPPAVDAGSERRSEAPTLSRDNSRASEYGNVFRNGAENYGVLPSSMLPPPIDPNNPSYNNLPISAVQPPAKKNAGTRSALMQVIYDKFGPPAPEVMQAHGYGVVKPRALPGEGGTYDVVPAAHINNRARASVSPTVHDNSPMELLDDVTLDSSGSGAGSGSGTSDSSAERKKGGGARMPGAGRNQYEAIASRLTLSPLPGVTPALPATMRAPIVPDTTK